jgi:predicted metal-dependent hydrolase
MPAVPGAIAAHAEVLRSDARLLAQCAERLREIGARLGGSAAAPAWLRETLDAHIAACATASADLDDAAALLGVYAGRARR